MLYDSGAGATPRCGSRFCSTNSNARDVDVTPQDRERLDAVTDALARMVRRQQEMEERLKRVEQGLTAAGWLRTLGPEAAPEPAGAPPVPPPVPPTPMAAPEPAEAAAPPYPVVPEPVLPPPVEEPRPGVESLFGLTWISRIGALTLVIGVAFFFKYAFENRWITETGRVLLGVAVGAGLVAAGERFWRKSQRIYGQALTAAGICFVYLSLWAANGLYKLLPQPPAFLLMTLATAGAVALALRYGGPAIAAIGLAGGFLTPILLETGHNPWFVLSYGLLLAIGGYRLARRWRYLHVLTFFGVMALYSTQWSNPIPDSDRGVLTFFAAAFYLIFLAGPLTGVALAAQFLFAFVMMEVFSADRIALLPPLLMSVAGLVAADRRGSPWFVTVSFAAWWLAYAAWWDEGGKRIETRLGTLAFQAAAYAIYLAWPVFRRVMRDLPLRRTELLLAGVNAALFFGTGYALLEKDYRGAEGYFVMAMAVTQIAAAALLWSRDRRAGMLSAGAAWTLLVLAAPIQFSGYRVTMAWSLEAAALAWIGSRLRDERISATALLCYLLVLLRLLVEDSWMFARVDYSPLFNARFFTFALSAAALFATAIWMREQWRAATAYIGGHFVLIWALCLEVSGWVARTASMPNLQSAQSTAISILIAVYAVAMVAAGVVRRSGLTRVIGIVLILFVVAKLYLYDVWLLRPFYRMVAFAVLGVALLLTANLYSRYRDKIGSWWRPE
jgi:uncharacterized membrane protein